MRICRWGLRSLCFLGVLVTAAAHGGCLSPCKALARAALACRIESEPTGATVSINGEYVGATPCTVGYRDKDKYEFVAELNGHQPAKKSFKEFPRRVLLKLTPLSEPPGDCELNTLPEVATRASVAVLDFQCNEKDAKQLGPALADYCRHTVQASQRYVLVDRENMRTLLSEEDFAATVKCDNTECLVDYGRKLRAQKIIHGRVSRVGEAYVLTIKMLDVGSAAVDALENAKVVAGVEQLVDFVPPTTCRLLRDALTQAR